MKQAAEQATENTLESILMVPVETINCAVHLFQTIAKIFF